VHHEHQVGLIRRFADRCHNIGAHYRQVPVSPIAALKVGLDANPT
jgi:hypothetical protein